MLKEQPTELGESLPAACPYYCRPLSVVLSVFFLELNYSLKREAEKMRREAEKKLKIGICGYKMVCPSRNSRVGSVCMNL